ncbi:VanW family protein [Spirillospora sp. NPDC047279]|uniref:VanW family protein n=1 Tax=Spirillospora sp. NPDC047279 TaxID=3155478 RepID=UPI0033CE9262
MSGARRAKPAVRGRHGRHRGNEETARIHRGQPGLGECALRWWPYVAGMLAATMLLLGAYLVAGTGPDSRGAAAAERAVVPGGAAPVADPAGQSGRRTARQPVPAPDGPTPQMRALGIHQRISSYTTSFRAGEPRVRNIQVGAARLDGTVVRPGATFSFNRVVGPRTRGRGYVPAPAILGERMVDDVGGGICQVSATLFNAVFDGGMKIRESRAHSMWLPEYPKGREAAVAYPQLDFTWHNDSGHPVMVRATHTRTTLTVSLWGTRRFDVRAERSKPYRFVPFSRSVDRGRRCVAMPGGRGFQVDVWRVLSDGGRHLRRERFHTAYRPQPQVRCT